MRYSRLSASFIFIAQDTRAHTLEEEKEREINTRIDVDSLHPRPASLASCLADVYWRRVADCR